MFFICISVSISGAKLKKVLGPNPGLKGQVVRYRRAPQA